MHRLKYSVTLVPRKEGLRQRCTHTIQTKGGISPRSVQRYTQRVSDTASETVAESNVLVRDDVLKCVSSNVGPHLVTYKHGCQILVTNPEDQLLIQQTEMMSGRQMILFNSLLVKMTGIIIHITSTTLADLQENQMPDYIINMFKLIVNKTLQSG
jgi:hypothetical protein